MPIYEYECQSCGRRTETMQRMSDPPLETCPLCQSGPMKKLVSAPAFQFKGTGWYVTDYARKGGKEGSGEAADKAGEKAEKADKSEQSDRSDKSDKSDKPDSSDKPKAAPEKPAKPSTSSSD